MLTFVIILFAVAAVFGLMLIQKVLKNEKPHRGLVYTHGAAAATALILLIISYADRGDNLLLASMLIFIVAALGAL